MNIHERILVSMTSYPKRISNVGKAVWHLLTKQTITPDEIHIWLAETEFPNKENDLPADLRDIIKLPTVFLHWLKRNTYCNKRHEIFKMTTDSDLVFLMDDDVYYNPRLIETVLSVHKRIPDCIVNYTHYAETDCWCGQSMIPAKLYPKCALKQKYQDFIFNNNIKSDEVFINRWIKHYSIPVYNELRFGWGTLIDKRITWHSGHAPRSKRVIWAKMLNDELEKNEWK